jgi:hypothetical protein
MQRHCLDPAGALGLRDGRAHDFLSVSGAAEGHRRHVQGLREISGGGGQQYLLLGEACQPHRP